MSNRGKINWLLILQGWAMFWVVIGHSFIGSLDNKAEWPAYERILMDVAYSFHMPLFMLVSGWLFYLTRLKLKELESNDGGYKWPYKSIVWDKTIRLLLPGLVFSLLAFAVKIAFPGEVARQTGFSFHVFTMAFVYPYDNPFREMWFIVTLYIFFLLAPLWQFALKQNWTKWALVVILVLLHFFHPETKFLSLDKICSHAIWFYLGLLVSKEDYVEKIIVKKPWLTILIGLIIYLSGWYIDSFIITVGGIVFSFGLALIADKYVPKLFFTFRNYTYQIFLIGIFAQMFVKILYRHVSMPYIVAYLLCILLGLYVPVVISKIIEKINWKPLSLCVGLKTK